MYFDFLWIGNGWNHIGFSNINIKLCCCCCCCSVLFLRGPVEIWRDSEEGTLTHAHCDFDTWIARALEGFAVEVMHFPAPAHIHVLSWSRAPWGRAGRTSLPWTAPGQPGTYACGDTSGPTTHGWKQSKTKAQQHTHCFRDCGLAEVRPLVISEGWGFCPWFRKKRTQQVVGMSLSPGNRSWELQI